MGSNCRQIYFSEEERILLSFLKKQTNKTKQNKKKNKHPRIPYIIKRKVETSRAKTSYPRWILQRNVSWNWSSYLLDYNKYTFGISPTIYCLAPEDEDTKRARSCTQLSLSQECRFYPQKMGSRLQLVQSKQSNPTPQAIFLFPTSLANNIWVFKCYPSSLQDYQMTVTYLTKKTQEHAKKEMAIKLGRE